MHEDDCPQCPNGGPWKRDKSIDDPRCICNKPLLLYVPAGEHVHCPVHPNRVIRGSEVRC